ncbi:MAG: hypothetical protein IJ497_01940 [Clostridia bacterium]|nr:hypothetical protein [Clostridia bacterium]
MKTRFDNTEHWIKSNGEAVEIVSMETTHILNTIRMLVCKPSTILAMLIDDIEHSIKNCTWSAYGDPADLAKESLNNVTSLSEEAFLQYIVDTPLFLALTEELEQRGVNVTNVLNLFMSEKCKVE